MMLYDNETGGLGSRLTHMQHHYSNIICSTMHIHLSERDCLEAITVKGDAAEIRKLSNELVVRKGVKMIKTLLVPN